MTSPASASWIIRRKDLVEEVQGLQRLSQIVACGRKEAVLRAIGFVGGLAGGAQRVLDLGTFDHFRGQAQIEVGQPQLALRKLVGAAEMRREHAFDDAALRKQRRALNGAESDIGGDGPVRFEFLVPLHIFDNHAGPGAHGPSAH
jgi:hypothetical protein